MVLLTGGIAVDPITPAAGAPMGELGAMEANDGRDCNAGGRAGDPGPAGLPMLASTVA